MNMGNKIKLHNNPTHFVQIVENALDNVYYNDTYEEWCRIHDFYTIRYLNPDSKEKQSLYKYGKGQNERLNASS